MYQTNWKFIKAQFRFWENQQLYKLLKDHFCLLPQYPACMLSTNCCEYTCTRVAITTKLTQSKSITHRVHCMVHNNVWSYILQTTIMSNLLSTKLIVVSALVPDQWSFSHVHRGILQLQLVTVTVWHHMLRTIRYVQTKQSQTVPFLTAGQKNPQEYYV